MITHNHLGNSLMPSSGASELTDTVMPPGWKLKSMRNAQCVIGFASNWGDVGLVPSLMLGHLNKQMLVSAIGMDRRFWEAVLIEPHAEREASPQVLLSVIGDRWYLMRNVQCAIRNWLRDSEKSRDCIEGVADLSLYFFSGLGVLTGEGPV